MIQFARISRETYIQTVRHYLDRLGDAEYGEALKDEKIKRFIKDANYERK